MNRNGLRSVCVAAVFTAVIAALSQIAIPTPVVYVTLQTLGIAVAAFLQTVPASVAATLCYVALGAAGVPVFAGFAAGIGTITGPTGGFILAFPVFALLLSLTNYVNQHMTKLLLCAAALIALYAAGVTQYAAVTGSTAKAAIIAFIFYFIKDVAVVFAAYFLCVRIRPTLSRFTHPK